MQRRIGTGLRGLVLCALTGRAMAGGSGLNVAVVVNQRSTNSVQLGNYLCERRQVPPQNVFRLTTWTGGPISWTRANFEGHLLNPLLSALASRQLTNQIDYVVLAMDIPYRVTETNGVNSTTAALYYGFKPDTDPPAAGYPRSCSLPPASSNSFAASEGVFRATPPGNGGGGAFLTTMITASNLARAKAIIDAGVASDGTFPTQLVYLAKSTDFSRNIRYPSQDNTVFDARVLGDSSIVRTNAGSPAGLLNSLGYQSGHYGFSVLPGSFVPGAMADSLTSFGGYLFEANSFQSTLLVFLNAGAAISYGTVVEPCGYLEKFPSPQAYFYQARGFSLAESYYLSVTNPYQGLIVGEPLGAPFARPPNAAWLNLPAHSLLRGTTNLALQVSASAPDRPVQQVDLFLDGTWLRTLTNLAPSAGNVLTVTINGQVASCTVPPNATIKSVTSGLVSQLNQSPYAQQTRVQAAAYGDRVDLQSTNIGAPGGPVSLRAGSAIGSAPALTTFVTARLTNFLDTVACGWSAFSVTNIAKAGDYLQLAVTKTNGAPVTITVTNTPPATNLAGLAERLLTQVNAAPELTGAEGLVAEDVVLYERYPELFGTDLHLAEFNLRARSAGWSASQIQATLSSAPGLRVSPTGPQKLDPNVNDLRPRNHLFVTAGVTNLSLTFPFNTTTLADGHHQLTAVAYEGSHVRAQQRVTQEVIITNTALAASLNGLVGDTNTAVEATLQFAVVANTNAVATIELFSTGGLLAATNNQSSALFSVAGTNLGIGLHPFYAIVTAATGKQYRTETRWLRLIGPDTPFRLTFTAPPPALSWPAAAGRRYEVLSADSVTNTPQLRQALFPTNSAGRWTDTNGPALQRHYRVRSSS